MNKTKVMTVDLRKNGIKLNFFPQEMLEVLEDLGGGAELDDHQDWTGYATQQLSTRRDMAECAS